MFWISHSSSIITGVINKKNGTKQQSTGLYTLSMFINNISAYVSKQYTKEVGLSTRARLVALFNLNSQADH